MLKPYFVAWVAAVGVMLLGAGIGSGQNYPIKPIRIVTSLPGGGNDFVTRLLAQELTGPLGQQVIADNRGSGVIPGEAVSKAPPDGYTLLLIASNFWIGPFMQETPYDVETDFAPIVLVGLASNILVVHPSLPVKSVKELVALAKARPGELNYSSAATGGSAHLAAELFKAMAGVNIVRVPYKGDGAGMNALIGGEVQLMFPNTPSASPHLKSGRVRALAVTGSQPSALVPGLHTVAAAGLPGYESGTYTALFAPAKTPATIINRLNQEVMRIVTKADVKAKFFNVGVEVMGSTPEQLSAMMKSDMAKWGKLIKDHGIRAE